MPEGTPIDMTATGAIHFEQYLALLRGFSETVQGLVIYDNEGCRVWTSDIDQSDQKSLESKIAEHRGKGCDALLNDAVQCLGDDLYV